MKLRNLFALLVVVLVSVSILFAQTETKKTDAPKAKDKSCCPSEKATKSDVKSDAKKTDCTSKDATHKHDGKSDCTSKEVKDAKKECDKGDDCCEKTGKKECDDTKTKDGKHECPDKTVKKEVKKS